MTKEEKRVAVEKMERIQPAGWEWFGNAGHFCASNYCRFHLTTKIGNHLVSTIGEWYPPGTKEMQPVGLDRFYETMVFEVDGACSCGCGLPSHSGESIYMCGYSDAASANYGHYFTCESVSLWSVNHDKG